MAKAKPEKQIESVVSEGVHNVMIRHSVWMALCEQAERVGIPPQEYLSMCLHYGIRKPWSVVEGLKNESD